MSGFGSRGKANRHRPTSYWLFAGAPVHEWLLERPWAALGLDLIGNHRCKSVADLQIR